MTEAAILSIVWLTYSIALCIGFGRFPNLFVIMSYAGAMWALMFLAFPNPNFGAKFAVMLMVLFWWAIGWLSGRKGFAFIKLFGFRGFSFNICAAGVGAGLGPIVYALIAYVLSLYVGTDRSDDLIRMLQLHGGTVICCLLLLPLTKRNLQIAVSLFLKKIMATASIVGVMSFVVDRAMNSFGINILWWIPNVPTPVLYEVLSVYGIGLLLSYPIFKSGIVLPDTSSAHGLLKGAGFYAALEREGLSVNMDKAVCEPSIALAYHNAEYKDMPRYASLVPYLPVPPKSWRATEPENNETTVWQECYPPNDRGTFYIKIGHYRRKLDEVPCRDESVSESERLLRTTRFNLVKRDATIINIESGMRNDFPFCECYYRRPPRRNLPLRMQGYVYSFIRDSLEHVFVWEAVDKNTFEEWLSEVRDVVTSEITKKRKWRTTST